MLNLVIAIIAFAIWSSIAIYYFRHPLTRWFDNRFGKDPVFPQPEDDEEQTHPDGQTAPAASASAPSPADRTP